MSLSHRTFLGKVSYGNNKSLFQAIVESFYSFRDIKEICGHVDDVRGMLTYFPYRNNSAICLLLYSGLQNYLLHLHIINTYYIIRKHMCDNLQYIFKRLSIFIS